MVKVCGITNEDDAAAAAQAGATALGFNFSTSSPRCIHPSKAAEIGERLEILRVGVFVDAPVEVVAAAVRTARLDIVQLHGNENPGEYSRFRVWKAYRVSGDWTMANIDSVAEAVLLDGPAPGTGLPFDWSRVGNVGHKVILAGGLGPENVGEAIRTVRPWGVDACSKLEKAPGIKDHERVRQFIRAALAESI